MGIGILDAQLISKRSTVLRAFGRIVEHEAVEAHAKIIDETRRNYFGVACNRILRRVESRPANESSFPRPTGFDMPGICTAGNV